MSNTSFDKIIDKVFDGFKKITPALIAITIVSGLVLFLPASILSKLGLNNLDPVVKSIMGFLFIISCSLILTILGSVAFQKIFKNINNQKILKDLKRSYIQLPVKQKKIIIKLMNNSSKSIELDGTSGDTLYLVENNFIFRPEQILDIYNGEYIYAPQPWLIDLFEKEPTLFVINLPQKKNKNHDK